MPGGRTIAIVGGGASGTLTAIGLLRTGGPEVRVVLIEVSGHPGYGVAYSTPDERHLLNVRAGNMSGFPDQPGDLLDWAAQVGRPLDPADFLPRKEYALYLRDRLFAAADDRLETVAARVTDIEPADGGGYLLSTADGPTVFADAVVLAYGNQAPGVLRVDGQSLPDAPWHVTDPWRLGWIETLPAGATVVLAGTGLTAIDTAITVLERDPSFRVVMVSRHGVLPKVHSDEQPVGWVTAVPEGPLTAAQLRRLVCGQIEQAAAVGVNWRDVVDGLRAATPSIWSRLDDDEKRAFINLDSRDWEIRRHRMAPEIAARLASYRDSGRLVVAGDGIRALTNDGDFALVEAGGQVVTASAVVNCTGPQTDITASGDTLLAALTKRGLLAPDPLRLGVSCLPTGEVLGADGQVVTGFFTVGPPRKGVLYETTAIPEIRVQAAEVARALVGGVRQA